MEVYFEFELDDNAEQPVNPKNLVYEELRRFFKSRYKVLEEQIDSFQNNDQLAFVVLILSGAGLETKQYNVPEHLVEKLRNCITVDDFNYITDKIWYRIQDEKRKN